MKAPTQSSSDARFTVLGVGLEKEVLATVKEVVSNLPDAEFLVNFSQYLAASGDQDLVQRMRQWAPDLCLVDFDTDRAKAAQTAERLQTILENRTAIFAVSAKQEPDLIIAAMRSGCTEYLPKPLTRERLRDAIDLIHSRRVAGKSGGEGRVIMLMGAKGGTGVTTLAVHLASFLPKLLSRKVLLIDQHPNLGDVPLYLGLDQHPYSFHELVGNIHRLDADLLRGFVLQHDSGLDVLTSPAAVDTQPPSGEDVEGTLEFLRGIYDLIVADCAPGLMGLNLSVAAMADEVHLVTTPEIPAVRNLSRYLDHLGRTGYPPERVRILVNRYSRKGVITKEKIEKALNRPVNLLVPNSYADVIEAINTGHPLAPDNRSEFARAVRDWAETYQGAVRGRVPQAEPKRRFGIL